MGIPLWNNLDIKAPPNLTCKIKSPSERDLQILSSTSLEFVDALQNKEILFREAAVLSRLIYRMKSMFRADKGFKCMEKIHHCLRHFLKLNLVSIYENLQRAIPSEVTDSTVHCPTLQMMEYTLLRTQGVGALLCRIIDTCNESTSFFSNRLSSGHNWEITILCFGAVSRIWALAKYLLIRVIKLYSTMYPFLQIFKHRGPLWLPTNYVFPSDLKKWLHLPWLQDQNSDNFGNLSETESEEKCDEEKPPQTENIEASNGIDHGLFQKPLLQKLSEAMDIGESVQRDGLPLPKIKAPCDKNSVSKKKSKKPLVETEVWKNLPKSQLNGVSLNNNLDKSDWRSESYPNSKLESSVLNGDSLNLNMMGEKSKNVVGLKNCPKFTNFKTMKDIQAFLKTERKRRKVTSHLPESQWKNLQGVVYKFMFKLKKSTEKDQRDALLKKLNKSVKLVCNTKNNNKNLSLS